MTITGHQYGYWVSSRVWNELRSVHVCQKGQSGRPKVQISAKSPIHVALPPNHLMVLPDFQKSTFHLSGASRSTSSTSATDSDDIYLTSRTSTSSYNPPFASESSTTSIKERALQLPWILHRILYCQLPCKISLRIMFAFNSGMALSY